MIFLFYLFYWRRGDSCSLFFGFKEEILGAPRFPFPGQSGQPGAAVWSGVSSGANPLMGVVTNKK